MQADIRIGRVAVNRSSPDYFPLLVANNILGGAASINNNSFGVAGQIGFDYALTRNWQLNVDLKWIQMATDVSVLGNKVGTVNLNPLTVGVGVGYRF